MTPWELLERATVPGEGGELRLYRRRDEFSIRVDGHGELMNSRAHGTEEALAEQTCARLSAGAAPRLLIGGLGMGFTLAAALRHLDGQAQVVVAELVPAVVDWNRGALGAAAGRPLDDPRVTVHVGDVATLLAPGQPAWDAILLDVDNGPEGLVRKENDWLYGMDGLNAARASLRPRGLLAVWSAGPDRAFVQRLRKTGFEVDEVRVRAHGSKGARHIVWFARPGGRAPAPGVSRAERLGDEGLRRLERQLATGRRPSRAVLDQWVRRYGEAARRLIARYDRRAGPAAPGPSSNGGDGCPKMASNPSKPCKTDR